MLANLCPAPYTFDSIRAARSGYRNPFGVRVFPHPSGPGAYPTSYTMGTESFPGVKRPRRCIDHLPPSSAEVKERIEQSFEALRHKTGGSVFDYSRVLGNFQVKYSFCPHSLALGSTQRLTNECQGISLGYSAAGT